MRTAFVETLTDLAERDSRIMLLVGDLGFGVVTDFAQRFPKQFLNVGVAEQNMAGVAAGLALAGKVVFTYSIANFPILRCLEQLRNDVCYHNANVISVAVGGGFSYGALGMTHHGTEDLAIMRSLPNMTVVAPGDPLETQEATKVAAGGIGPVFLRLGRAGEPVVHKGDFSWELGKAISVQTGISSRKEVDLTLIATGAMLHTAVAVAEFIAEFGIEARVLSMHTVKPLDRDAILAAAYESKHVATLEEHSILGGLGGAVAEVLAEAAVSGVAFRRFGLPSEFTKHVGSQAYLRHVYGLSPDALKDAIVNWIGGRHARLLAA